MSKKRLKRAFRALVSAGLSAVLAGLAPGLEFYRALAADIVVSGPVVEGAGALGPGFVDAVPNAQAPGATGSAASGNLLRRGLGSFSAHPGRVHLFPSPLRGEDARRADEGMEEWPLIPSPLRLRSGQASPLPAVRGEEGVRPQQDSVRALEREGAGILREQRAPSTPISPESALNGGAEQFERAVFGRRLGLGNGVRPGVGPDAGAASPRGPPRTSWPRLAGPGAIDQSQAVFEPHELELAQILKAEGHAVKALPVPSGLNRRGADAEVDLVRVELKTRLPGRSPEERWRQKTRADWIVKVVERSLGIDPTARSYGHGRQGRVLLLDARGTRLEARHVHQAVAALAAHFGPRLDSLRVLGNGFDLAFGAWPGPRPAQPRAGNGIAAKTVSGLSPPAYHYPLLPNLWLQATRVLHYGFHAAALTALSLGLGFPGALAPVALVGTYVATYWHNDRRILAARAGGDPNGMLLDAVSDPASRGDPEVALWFRSWRLMAGLLRGMGLDPRRDMPELRLVSAYNEDGTRNEDAWRYGGSEGAGSEGNGIRPESYLGLGEKLATRSAGQVQAVMAHELSHLRHFDARITRSLRIPGQTRVLVGKLLRYGILGGAALDLSWAGIALAFGHALPWFAFGGVSGLLLSAALVGSTVPLVWAGWVFGNALTRAKEFRADHEAAFRTHPKWMADFLEKTLLPGERRQVTLDHLLGSPYPTAERRIHKLRRLQEKAGPAPDESSLGALWVDPFVAGIPGHGIGGTGRPGNGVAPGEGTGERAPLTAEGGIALLFARERSGHAQAAKALEAAFAELVPITRVDHVRWEKDGNPRASRWGTRLYTWVLGRAPFLWEFVYDNPMVDLLTSIPVSQFLLWSGRKLSAALKLLRPQAAVCTQALMCASLAAVKAKRQLRIPLVGVLTDFTLNSFWVRKEVDHYFVASDEVRDLMVGRGVEAYKITVSGIPIHRKFSVRMPKSEARLRLGLHPGKRTVLISGGNHGLGGLRDVLRAVKSIPDVQVIVVTGANQELYKRLKAENLGEPGIRVEGFIDDMELRMAAADVMIGKPGGLSASEALAMALPLIITSPLPGQETRNTRYLTRRNAAVLISDVSNLGPELVGLLNDPRRLAALQHNALLLARPDAADVIARKIHELVAKG